MNQPVVNEFVQQTGVVREDILRADSLEKVCNTYTYVGELRFFNTNQKSWFTIPCYVSPVKLLRYGWDVEENMTCTSLAALVLLSHFLLHSPPSARSQNKRMVEERQTGERDGRAGCLTFAPIRRIVASASVRPSVRSQLR